MVGHGNERLAMQRRIADLESALQSAWQESATLKAALAESERTLRLVRSDLREAMAVPCADHAHGLRGSLVDGNEGCPWCRVAESERARHRAEDCVRSLKEAKAERDAYRAALRALVNATLRCSTVGCQERATVRVWMANRALCDAHARGQDGDEYAHADPLRAALALLAKGSKP